MRSTSEISAYKQKWAEENREKSRLQKAKWATKNPNYQKEWREKNKIAISERRKAKYLLNREASLEKSKAYRIENSVRLKEFRRLRYKNSHESEKIKLREYNRKRRGLPRPDRACPDLCEICSSPPGKKSLALDHCHKTGKFRGWLCGRCNPGIGAFQDSIEILKNAIFYLEKNG